MIFNINSDLAFDFLIKIEKWKEAIILARDRKNIDILNKLIGIAPNEFRE